MNTDDRIPNILEDCFRCEKERNPLMKQTGVEWGDE